MTFGFPDSAFKAFEEPLKWRQDKSPHRTGTFMGTVLHGTPDATNAGHPLGEIVADPWHVFVSQGVALVSGVRTGDTLTRVGIGAEVLTVQSVSRDDTGWILVCSLNERASE